MAAQKPPRLKQQQPPEQQAEPQPFMAEEPPTSRLCIKNIPKYVAEQRLKAHFAAKGQVTDIKILKTR
jgi:multiple RNA-binding domain-containing protein 1